MDLFDLELKPVLNESVIKDEQMGRYYEKVANLTIPVYIYYEGNATEVRITFYAGVRARLFSWLNTGSTEARW